MAQNKTVINNLYYAHNALIFFAALFRSFPFSPYSIDYYRFLRKQKHQKKPPKTRKRTPKNKTAKRKKTALAGRLLDFKLTLSDKINHTLYDYLSC